MEAIFFALISFVGWAISDVFVTISSRKLGAYSGSFWSGVMTIVLLGFYTPFALGDLKNITIQLFLFTIFLSLFLLVGIITYREALIVGNSSLVVTIGAAFTAVTTIASIFVFHEHLLLTQAVAISVIFLGIFLSMLDFTELAKKRILVNKGVFLALVSMFTWGIYFTFIKIPVRELGWFWPNYLSFLPFPFLYFYMKIYNIPLQKPRFNHAFLWLFLAMLFSRIAELSFNLGIAKGYTSIVAPIAGSGPVLFVILAFFFLKDPITKQQITGIVTTLIGIVLLSFFSA